MPEMNPWLAFALGVWAGSFLGAGILMFFMGARTPDLRED
jgi:zinc transporter ZupT